MPLIDISIGLDLLQPVLDQITSVWHVVKSPLSNAVGLFDNAVLQFTGWDPNWKNALLNEWVGFGVDISDWTAPKVCLAFRTAAAPAPVNRLFPFLGDLIPSILPCVNFRAIAAPVVANLPAVSEARSGAAILYQGTDKEGALRTAFGTLCAFLEDDLNNIWLLSANHVIGMNGECLQNQVSLPSGQILSDQTPVVTVISDSAINQADAAATRCGPDFQVNTSIPGITNRQPLLAQAGLTALKPISVATTTGRISYIMQCVEVGESECCGVSRAVFSDQILISNGNQPFSGPGDSGALVLALQGNATQPLGMLIANNSLPANAPATSQQGTLSVVTPWNKVLAALSSADSGRTFRLAQ